MPTAFTDCMHRLHAPTACADCMRRLHALSACADCMCPRSPQVQPLLDALLAEAVARAGPRWASIHLPIEMDWWWSTDFCQVSAVDVIRLSVDCHQIAADGDRAQPSVADCARPAYLPGPCRRNLGLPLMVFVTYCGRLLLGPCRRELHAAVLHSVGGGTPSQARPAPAQRDGHRAAVCARQGGEPKLSVALAPRQPHGAARVPLRLRAAHVQAAAQRVDPVTAAAARTDCS